MSAQYFDAYEGAQLLGVTASTVRSWIKRGHLPVGRYRSGKLTWTEMQLSQAKASARRESVVLRDGQSQCSRGHTIKTQRNGEQVIADCEQCEISIAIPMAATKPFVTAFAHHRGNLDIAETSIDPNETGPAFRMRAMQVYLQEHANGPQVYFIRMGPYVKIGTSIDVPRRITSLSLQLRHLMATIDGGAVEERKQHQRFAHLNAFGEWFYLRDELLDFLIGRQREQIQQVLVSRGIAT